MDVLVAEVGEFEGVQVRRHGGGDGWERNVVEGDGGHGGRDVGDVLGGGVVAEGSGGGGGGGGRSVLLIVVGWGEDENCDG